MYIINKKSDKHTDISEQGCRIDFNYIRTIFPDPYDFSEFVRVFQIRMIFPDPYDFSGYVGFFQFCTIRIRTNYPDPYFPRIRMIVSGSAKIAR